MKHSARYGFTLIEIMLVVSIIALLAVIAVPNLIKAREMTQKTTCDNNKRLIYDAIGQWALVENKGNGTVIDDLASAAIAEYIKGGVLPKCQAGDKDYILSGTVAMPKVECDSGFANHNAAEEEEDEGEV